MFEDALGIRKIGSESSNEGEFSERERKSRERSVGFDEVGMELFELKWGVEAVEKIVKVLRSG